MSIAVRRLIESLVFRLRRRVRAVTQGRELDREHDEEARFHLECEAADLARRHGLSPDEARRRALIAFGGVSQVREAHREARRVTMIDAISRDVHYSLRALRRSRAYSLSVILVLGLGVGTCTAVFSAVDAVLLARLPYPEPDRVVRIYLRQSPTIQFGLSTVDAQAIAGQARSLATVGIMEYRDVALAFGREPMQAPAGSIDAGVLKALDVRPPWGRPIAASDDVIGATPVALVSDALATKAYASPDNAVGRSITVDGVSHTIIGVLAPGVDELAGFRADVWPALHLQTPTRRGPFNLRVVARLAPAATLEQAGRELSALSRRVYPQWASSFQDSIAVYTPVPLRTTIVADSGTTLALFASAVGLVLLIVVANVANLTFVRTIERQRELALRQTLGATRSHVTRLLVTESILLALGGALLGLVLAIVLLNAVRIANPPMARLDEAHVGLHAGLFAFILAAIVGAVVGLMPTVLLMRGVVARPTGDTARTVSQSRGTVALRGSLVVGQFALALPLLAGAGLLLNSFLRLEQVWPGFDPSRVLTVRLSLPHARYQSDSSIRSFWTRAVNRVQDLPGVEAVGLSTAMPPRDENACCNNFNLTDHPVAPGGAQPMSPWIMASEDYFATLGLKRLEGRPFTPGDTGAVPVIAVSASWAHHYFPEGDAIGRQLIQGGCVSCPLTTVVAVVGDAKYVGLDANSDAVYSPITEAWTFARSATVFVRTVDRPLTMSAAVRTSLRSLDPTLPLDDVEPLATRIRDSLKSPRQLASLLGAFAFAALLLAAVGIFGMLSYAVSTRRREIGVRLALGARPRSVVGMVVRGGMVYACAGAFIGCVATVLSVSHLTGHLFEVTPTDPATLLIVACILLGVAFFASLLPALRASHIDPLESIRTD